MGKRKHSDDEINDSSNKIREKKKSKKVTLDEEDEYDIWLVCKPRSIQTDILNDIKFPKSIREKNTLIEKKVDNEDRLHMCNFNILENQLSILDNDDSNKDNNNFVDYNVKYQVGGILNITCNNDISDGFPMPPEENFMDLNGNMERESFPFTIKKVNRKPQLNLDNLKQRLQAFGSIKKKEKKRNKIIKKEINCF
ncbi:Hypothetical protein SRAE_2000469900 [Strongyloides ratti]|uniref:Uncharacterized protein n=1 Tax=Strongyloides ratti TaxID=34506 RepID=A0A090LK17_STRRB|nr:Hypothetical protein SRAE_2000469900 [Strongyloides ratti]CEF70058.1 Hypothetical protein SRAE_2000469900 [Strongyloides ratti]